MRKFSRAKNTLGNAFEIFYEQKARWAANEIISRQENVFWQVSQKFHKQKTRWAANEIILRQENAFCRHSQKFHEQKMCFDSIRKNFISRKRLGQTVRKLSRAKITLDSKRNNFTRKNEPASSKIIIPTDKKSPAAFRKYFANILQIFRTKKRLRSLKNLLRRRSVSNDSKKIQRIYLVYLMFG